MSDREMSLEERVARLEAKDMTLHSRYPYTFAYDYLREVVGAEVSRSEMSQRVKEAAKCLGMDDPLPLIRRLADAYIARANS